MKPLTVLTYEIAGRHNRAMRAMDHAGDDLEQARRLNDRASVLLDRAIREPLERGKRPGADAA